METKQLVIMVFVFVCSAARAEESEDRNIEQIQNTTETATAKIVPPEAQLLSLSEEEWTETSSDPVKSTTVIAEIVKNVSTQNETEATNIQDHNKTEKTPSTPKSEIKDSEKKSNEKGFLFEEVPKVKDNSQNNKEKRETKKEDSKENKPRINQESYPDTTNTETTQTDEEEKQGKVESESDLSRNRAQINNKVTSVSDQITDNKSKGEQVREKNTDSTNKQPSSNSKAVKNRGEDSESNNKKKTVVEEENKPKNRDNSHDDVFDPENSEPELLSDEIEDFAQSIIHQTMISEEPKKHTSRTNSRKVNYPNESRRHRTSSKSPGYARKSSSRGTTQGRQTDETPCDRTNEIEPESKEFNDGQKTKSLEAEGEESKVLPRVINVTTVLPTTETSKPSTAATTIPTKVTINQTQRILTPSNSTIYGNSTTANTKGGKWKKSLNIIGQVITVFTIIGGAFYLVYSVM